MGLETTTLAYLAIGSGIAGTGMSMYGSYQQGQQQAAQARYQAQIAANNAQIANQNAKDTEAAGAAEEQRKRIENSQRTSALRAAAGASGVDVGTGSALDSFADATMIGEYDALSVRNNYQRQANAYYQQAANFTNDSALYRQAASNATGNALTGMAGSLLSGAGQVASSWYSFKDSLTSQPSRQALGAGTVTNSWSRTA